jgi:hypothetical protein
MVRKTIKEFDVEIVEYSGGGYSHKPLLGCDMLVVIPELSNPDEDMQYVPLGKGLHEQITAFTNQNNKCDLLTVFECDSLPLVAAFQELDVADTDDYVNYSFALLDDDESDTLQSVMENRCGLPTTSTNVSSESRYRLLLTKKLKAKKVKRKVV